MQTMFPPSIHPDGERVEWYKDGTPARIGAEDLHQAVKLIAAAALLGRYWAGPSARDAAAGPLIGTLLRAGWEADKVRHFVGAVAQLGGDPSWRGRLHGIEKMQERLAGKSGRVPGLPALKKLFDARVIASVVEWLDLKPGGRNGGTTQAERLLAIARGATLFHDEAGDCYADFEINGHYETWPIHHKNTRLWLAYAFFQETGKLPSSTAMTTVLEQATACATFDGPTAKVFLRNARHDGKIYLDLVDDTWRAIEIDGAGWRIVERPPVRFRRTKGMLPLPVAGGTVAELRPFLNVADVDKENPDDADFKLAVAWILAALSGLGPYPIMSLYGPPGAAKSSFARYCRACVDPNKIPARGPARDDRDVYIAAHNAHVVSFGNLSHLPPWLSDTLARLSTGDGFGTRELYTDADEVLFDGMRPVILNGIENFITRSDLADRCILLVLEHISDAKRRTEADLGAAFAAAQPRILGALLSAAAGGPGKLASAHPGELPRMADFAESIGACEPALGWEAGTFARLYAENRETGLLDVLNADLIGSAMHAFVTSLGTAENSRARAERRPADPEKCKWEGTTVNAGSKMHRLAGVKMHQAR
jgi:hypothetical protein